MRSYLIILAAVIFTGCFGLPCFAECPSADVTGDCFVDFEDFAVFASNWANVSDVNAHASTEWTSIEDVAGGRDRIYQVETDSNDGIYVMVSVTDPCGPDGLLAKYSAESNEPLWSIRIPYQYSYEGLAIDANGYVYIGGSSIRKINPDNGSEIWSISYNDLEWDHVHIDSSRNIYATSRDQTGYILAKFFPDNNTPAWTANNDGSVTDVIIDGNDNIYVVDSRYTSSYEAYSVMTKYTSSSNEPIWTCLYDDVTIARLTKDLVDNIIVSGCKGDRWYNPNTKIFTAKHSPDSNIPLWITEFYEFNEPDVICWPAAIVTDLNGNVYISGVADCNGDWDFITIKYDTDGNRQWADRYDSSAYECVKDIEVDSNNNIYVTGDTSAGGQDAFTTLKYNPDGDIVWEAHYHGPGSGRIVYEMESTAIDRQNNIYVGGSVGDDSGWITESQDYVLVKYEQFNCSEQLIGDFDHNYIVDYNDFAMLAEQWLTTDPCAPPDMAYIPDGSFLMGDSFSEGYLSERPVHTVTLSSFYMGKYEITNGQYCAYLNSALGSSIYVYRGIVYGTGNNQPYCDTSAAYSSHSQINWNGSIFSVRSKSGRSMSNDPMMHVSWCGAAAYCNWRSQIDGREQCYTLSGSWPCDFNKKGYRLPTEAEWEYAARGGLSGKRFPWGDTISQTHANFYSSTAYSYDVSPVKNQLHPLWNDGVEQPYTSPVGFFDGQLKYKTVYNWPSSATSYQTMSGANNYGLYDMAGNVWEWCNDWDGEYSSDSQMNPTGPSSGENRILRGGGWGDSASGCRVAVRLVGWSSSRYYHYGFRVVLDLN